MEINTIKSINKMKSQEKMIITEIKMKEDMKSRFAAMGIIEGVEIEFVKSAPLGDPVQLYVRGSNVCLRKRDAAMIFGKDLKINTINKGGDTV